MIEPTRKAPMTIATVLPKRAVTLLDRVRSSTDQIRGAEDDIKAAAAQRRKDVVALRSMRVTYREIAEAMGVTEQVVYKILREEISLARSVPCPGCDVPVDPRRYEDCPECSAPLNGVV